MPWIISISRLVTWNPSQESDLIKEFELFISDEADKNLTILPQINFSPLIVELIASKISILSHSFNKKLVIPLSKTSTDSFLESHSVIIKNLVLVYFLQIDFNSLMLIPNEIKSAINNKIII